MSKEENWENENPIDLRTKIALKVLFLMFKILSPYRFAHQMSEDIENLKKDLESLK